MRIFVYEYLSAGEITGSAAAALRTEGWAMLSALLEDFDHIPGVEVETVLGAAMAAKKPPASVIVHRVDSSDEDVVFRRLAAAADWTLVVAPEIDGILPDTLQRIEEAHGRSLNATPEAARLTGDKLLLADHLRERGVPTPPTVLWPASAPSYPAVCKLRRGAGSQATFLVRNEDGLRRAVEETHAEWQEQVIVQPYLPGQAASVAFLVGPDKRLALPAAAQHLSTDGRFHYQGGSLPLAPDLAERATRLAARAVEAVEGLRGYVGVDLVLGPSADGDAVIETNARLTTSYVGLRALARFNLADALLAVVQGNDPAAWEWRTGQVHFSANGAILRLPVVS
jgi:tyramine---L-glutamate ligase